MIRCITLLLAVLVGLAPGLSAENYIKWVDCNYSYDALDTVYAA